MHLFTAIFGLLLPTAVVVVAEPTLFSNARDFYHGLTVERQQIVLHSAKLEDPEELRELCRLLSNKTVDIQGIYNRGCNFISWRRADQILVLTKDNKNLEQLLLGASCLSNLIISARKDRGLWPPSGMPLLVRGLDLTNRGLKEIQQILKEALKHPEFWYSRAAVRHIKWANMNDLRFWRLIPAKKHSSRREKHLLPYLKRSLFAIDNPSKLWEVEELWMKMIRMQFFKLEWAQSPEEKDAFCGLDGLLKRFGPFRTNPWCASVLNVLDKLCSKNYVKESLPRALLSSTLLDWTSWEAIIGLEGIDQATAISDMLELLTFATQFSKEEMERNQVAQKVAAFLASSVDLSLACPLPLKAFVKTLHSRFDRIIRKYAHKLLLDDRLVTVMPDWLPMTSQHLQVMQARIKKWIRPLMESFMEKSALPSTSIGTYKELLYKEWVSTNLNWLDLVAIHQRTRERIRDVVLVRSTIEPDTWNPKLDAVYDKNAWRLAFLSIRFDIEHDMPNRTVLSMCFLRALVQFHKGNINWSFLVNPTENRCGYPGVQLEQAFYTFALNVADDVFFWKSFAFPRTDASLLQAVMRGVANEDTQLRLDELLRVVREM